MATHDLLARPFFQHQRLPSDFHVRAEGESLWRTYAEKYEGWLSSSSSSEGAAIATPAKIHQIWIGSKVPDYVQEYSRLWRDLNPSFEYQLWSEEDILDLGLCNIQQFINAPNPGVKSDLARYEILERFGGLYADTDFLPLKPIPRGLMVGAFFAAQVFSYTPSFANGLLVAPPDSRVLRRVIESIGPVPNYLTPMETLAYSGADILTGVINSEFLYDPGIVLLPSQYCYPWPNFLLESSSDQFLQFCTRETFAVHLWKQSWMIGRGWPARLKRGLREFKSRYF